MEALRKRLIPLDLLVVRKRLSKEPYDYASQVHHAVAAKQLIAEGYEVHAGQLVRYIITDADAARPQRRVKAWELAKQEQRYDVEKYEQLLKRAIEEVTEPFGLKLHLAKQTTLF